LRDELTGSFPLLTSRPGKPEIIENCQTSPTILDFEENQGLMPMRFAHSLYMFIRRSERPFPCDGVPGNAWSVSVMHFSRALYVAALIDACLLFDAA
jgi:hypothetical protein